jgi:hypothetical protein
MAERPATRDELRDAIARARDGDWDGAHRIVQAHENDPMACWLHALLHKIEGDAENARYWYARSPRRYDGFSDDHAELDAIAKAVG